MSKQIILICTLLCAFVSLKLSAQIKNIKVETYYISNAIDATNEQGGMLPLGSKTYRVFAELMPDTKIRKIYGDENHPIKFSSSLPIYNNSEDGQNLAKDINKNRYANNLVALDSWLTIGQTTKTSASTNFGILKTNDTNGSFIGGANNDGGSAGISYGLLTNANAEMGLPLTQADGMIVSTVVPTNWKEVGFTTNGEDLTIFGSGYKENSFESKTLSLSNSGVSSSSLTSSEVLLAQITTLGTLTFELNIEVEEKSGDNTQIVKYVADNSTLLDGEKLNSLLKYPALCGCKDLNYLGASSNFACEDKSLCKTLIKIGCMDPQACNFDPTANFNDSYLCCYVGYCNDRNIDVVCPDLPVRAEEDILNYSIMPNPVNTVLNANILSNQSGLKYSIFDVLGRSMVGNVVLTSKNESIDVSKFNPGIYYIKIYNDSTSISKIFNKI